MIANMSSFMDPTASDELTRFFGQFHFAVNGFSTWKRQPVDSESRHGFICDYQLIHIERGRLRFKIHDQEHICAESSFILFEPFVVYTLEVLTPDDFYCYKIHFDILPEYRKNVLFSALVRDHGNVYHVGGGELPALEGLFDHLYASVEQKRLGTMAETEAILRLALVHMLRIRWTSHPDSIPVTAMLSSSREVTVVNQCVQYIGENLAEPIRVSSISKSLNISENYLYKCFMEVLQTPPSRYIQQYKVRRSVEMLMTTDASVEEVAAQLGFSSLHHFSKTFKQMLGASPRAYINAMNDKAL